PCGRGSPRGVSRARAHGGVPDRGRARRPYPGVRPAGTAARARATSGRVRGAGRRRDTVRTVALLGLALGVAVLAQAAGPGGRVTDDTGAPVAGALVTARHLALARATTVYADASGRF